jgi:toxin YoeB
VRVVWANLALEQYRYWERVDPKITVRIKELIDDIVDGDPFTGLGKPEPLKHRLAGYWSRRITREHRLVYMVAGTPSVLTIVQCRYHY